MNQMRRLRTSLDVFMEQSLPTKRSSTSTDIQTKGTTPPKLQLKNGPISLWVPEWNDLGQSPLRQGSESCHSFCPFCGDFIVSRQSAMGCTFKNSSRIYLAHLRCLNDSTLSLSQDLEELIQSTIATEKMAKQQRIFALGEKQFLVTVQVMHPLSSYVYFKSCKKLTFNGKSLIWDFNKQEDWFLAFEPNMICLPVNEFKLVLTFTDMAKETRSKQEIKLLVNLSPVSHQHKIATFSAVRFNTNIKGEFSIYRTEQEKIDIVEAMNFKYKYSPTLPESIIRMNRIEIVINEIEENQKENPQKFMTQYSMGSPLYCLNPEKSRWGYSSMTSEELHIEMMTKSADVNDFSRAPQSTNFPNRKELKEYVCSHAGSKQFQKTIQHMKPEEIDEVIDTLYYDLPELIVHEYANYMFQSLTNVCSLPQRLKILETLKPKMASLVCTKQGTFSLQQFISFLTHQSELYGVCSSISAHFIQLSKDPHGTHFVRKLVKCFPAQFLVGFANECYENFLKMVVDKNAICVIKAFFYAMKNLRQDSCLMETKKKLIGQMTINLGKIIQDQFGNYIVQEAYEIFGEESLVGVTHAIVDNFAIYSSEKISSNVVLKCVRDYWKSQGVHVLLRDRVDSNQIVAMFKNREGNRILLELLEKEGEFGLKERIEETVTRLEFSRFNQQRWSNSARRSRTGTVGTNFRSFSDSIQYNSAPMKKNSRKLH